MNDVFSLPEGIFQSKNSIKKERASNNQLPYDYYPVSKNWDQQIYQIKQKEFLSQRFRPEVFHRLNYKL